VRVLVTGGRHHTMPGMVWAALDELTATAAEVTVVHGACPTGADLFANDWATKHGATIEAYPAQEFGPWPQCGPIRNRHMVSVGADVCCGFPTTESRGTWGCLRAARNAKIPVHITRLPDDPPKRVWERPISAVNVTRPGPLGNPFQRANTPQGRAAATELYRRWLSADHRLHDVQVVSGRVFDRRMVLAEIDRLRGWDLLCSCPLLAPGEPDQCHAVVQLAVANRRRGGWLWHGGM
jgi:hypothetical protein